MASPRLLSVYLNAIMEKNVTAYVESLAVLSDTGFLIYLNYGPEAIIGIQCPDINLRSDSIEGVQSIIEYNYRESY